MDLENIQTQRERLQFRGAMGTTGSMSGLFSVLYLIFFC